MHAFRPTGDIYICNSHFRGCVEQPILAVICNGKNGIGDRWQSRQWIGLIYIDAKRTGVGKSPGRLGCSRFRAACDDQFEIGVSGAQKLGNLQTDNAVSTND